MREQRAFLVMEPSGPVGADLAAVVRTAVRRTGLEPVEVVDGAPGGGVQVLAEGPAAAATLAGPLLDHLVIALAAHEKVRVRVTVGTGEPVPVRAAVLRETLRAAGRAQCVVACDAGFHDAVVRPGGPATRPWTYREAGDGLWLRVPGYRVPPVAVAG